MTFLWVIIYLVAGFGAYWIVFKMNCCIENEIVKKFGEKANDVHADYSRRTQIVPQIHSMAMYFALFVVALIGAWVLWPVMAVGCGIYEWFTYRHVDKIWSERLSI